MYSEGLAIQVNNSTGEFPLIRVHKIQNVNDWGLLVFHSHWLEGLKCFDSYIATCQIEDIRPLTEEELADAIVKVH